MDLPFRRKRMNEPSRQARFTIVILSAAIIFGLATWLAFDDEDTGAGNSGTATTERADPPEVPTTSAGGEFHVHYRDSPRLEMRVDALPERGPVIAAIELPAESRAEAEQRVRVVAMDGRRLDLLATPLPESAGGIRIEIDPGFLKPGVYMIEVETADLHPLAFRRFFLELE
jgi:hypothetical protein